MDEALSSKPRSRGCDAASRGAAALLAGQQTVCGEPLEIYPFLGSSRLEEPLGRYPVSLVFHGHAHRGQLEGKTKNGASVYNVSMPLLTRTFTDRPPFRVCEVTVDAPPPAPTGRRATDAPQLATAAPDARPE